MTMNRTMLASALAVSFGGCTLASDLDRFEQDPICSPEVNLTAFSFHAPLGGEPGHTMNFRLVKRPTGGGLPVLRALAILDPSPSSNYDLVLPNAVDDGDGPFDLQFFADVNADDVAGRGVLSDGDHSWLLEDICATSPVAFEHTSDFDSFEEPQTNSGDLRVEFANMPVTNAPLEVQLVRTPALGSDEGLRTIGLYRLRSVDAEEFTVLLPGIVDPDPSITYEVRIWADGNGNAVFEPNLDLTWIVAADGGMLDPLAFDAGARETEPIDGALVTIVP